MNKGEIWLVEIPSSVGHEQSGKRPAVILTEVEVNTLLIIHLTSNLQALRFPHTIEIKPSNKNGLTSISIALVFQMRAIDKRRLINKLGILEESNLTDIDVLLKKMLKL